MISKKETNLLVKYYQGLDVDPQKLEKLNKPAQKILNNTEMSDNEKLELLYDIRTQFKFTGQYKIPMNDIEACMMKGKKGNFLIAYNVQSAVDYDTKLIYALNITQNPTDHYELPAVADKAINKTGKVPKYMSADTIYLNQISLSYFIDNGIDGLIPTRKQSKEKIGQYSAEDGYPIKYHDYFTDSVKDSNDFYERVFNIINERLIPYMVLHHGRDGLDYVCFTSGLRKALENANEVCYNIKSIAELLGWEYKTVRIPESTKVMVVRFDKFLNFLYPNLSEKEANQ